MKVSRLVDGMVVEFPLELGALTAVSGSITFVCDGLFDQKRLWS